MMLLVHPAFLTKASDFEMEVLVEEIWKQNKVTEHQHCVGNFHSTMATLEVGSLLCTCVAL